MEDAHAQIAAAVCDAAALPRTTAATWSASGSSALNTTAMLSLAGRRFFVKMNAADRASMFAAESDGLAAIVRTRTIRVPRPIATGTAGAAAFLALEWLELGHGGRDATLGHALAAMHRHTGPRFGWHRDNTIGTTPQRNAWSDAWPEFFRDRRLAPQLALAAERGHVGALQRSGDRLLERLPALFAGHGPAPSLVHGDLWSGNAASLGSGEPVLFDPAVYYGDRETDLAMSALFGGFGPDFYAAYDDAWRRSDGHEVRATAYNLYHVLNHLNLFGGGYRRQAEAMIGELLSLVR